jgi:hypothetical protein
VAACARELRHGELQHAARAKNWLTQALNPPRGGGNQPVRANSAGCRRTFAWNVAGNNPVPTPAAATDRNLLIWATPHGFLKAALQNNATVKSQTVGGKKLNVVSFTTADKRKMTGYINDQNLVERVETWIDNPVLGDMLVQARHSDYKLRQRQPRQDRAGAGGYGPGFDDHRGSTPPWPAVRNRSAIPRRRRFASSRRNCRGVHFVAAVAQRGIVKDYITVIEGPQAKSVRWPCVGSGLHKPIRYPVNSTILTTRADSHLRRRGITQRIRPTSSSMTGSEGAARINRQIGH